MFLKESMKLNLNFQRGWGQDLIKKFQCKGYVIFLEQHIKIYKLDLAMSYISPQSL